MADLEQALLRKQAAAPATDWTVVPLTVLADHILDTHHAFTRTQLDRIDTLLAKVQNAHRSRYGAMLDSLRNAFDPLRAELEAHLMKEEQILFPAIGAILTAVQFHRFVGSLSQTAPEILALHPVEADAWLPDGPLRACHSGGLRVRSSGFPRLRILGHRHAE
ncbi:MAG TPA: hemerythrin domain-containing protein [Kiritimatiellia bacterium]|nr:hemerythrin domain-containing protein [Kiritimatiellia bacterium]HRU69500.1 hemerythrin domain-containing protein [Kiritimatiellia bacterium]